MRVFGDYSTELRRFNQLVRAIRSTGIRLTMLAGCLVGTLTLASTLALTLVYGLGGIAVIQGTMTLGTLVALAMYIQRLYAPSLSTLQALG